MANPTDPATSLARTLRDDGLTPSDIAARLNDEGVPRDGRPHTWMRTDVVHLLGLPLSRSIDDDAFVAAPVGFDGPERRVATPPRTPASSLSHRPRNVIAITLGWALRVLGVVGVLLGVDEGGRVAIFAGVFVLALGWAVAAGLDILVSLEDR